MNPRGLIRAATVGVSVLSGLAIGSRNWGAAPIAALGLAAGAVGVAKGDVSRVAVMAIVVGWAAGAFLTDSGLVRPFTTTAPGEVSLSAGKTGPLALLAIGATLLWHSSQQVRAGPRLGWPRPEHLFIGYVCVSFVAALMSPTPTFSSLRTLQSAAPLVAALSLMRHRADQARVLLGAVFGVAVVHVSAALIAPRSPLPHGLTRATGLTHPNLIALLAASLVVLGAWFIVHESSIPLGAVALCLGVVGIVAARGRAGALSALLGAVVVAVSRPSAANALAVRVRRFMFATSMTCGGLLLGQSALEWYRRGDPNSLATLTGRTTLWRALEGFVVQRPLLGWGPGALRGGALTADVQRQFPGAGHAHNSLMEVAVNTGAFGATLWLGAMVLLGVNIWRLRSRFSVLLRGLFMLASVNAVTESGAAGFGVMWFLLIAVVASAGTDARKPASWARQSAVIHRPGAFAG